MRRWWGEHVVPRLVDQALKGRDLGELRAEVCAGLSGRVVEIGFGGGLNQRFLPAAVSEVGAVEPSDRGWQLSARRRARSSIPVSRVGLDGQAIAADAASYDAALCTFTLCTVPDPAAVIAEVRRVVRPGGRLHLLEHGLAAEPGTVRWQRLLDPWQQRLVGGCHLTRDPAALLSRAGVDVSDLRHGPSDAMPGPTPLTYLYRGSVVL